MSVSACNHRRDALTNLVKVLYGRRAAATVARPRPHRGRAGAIDAGVEDRSTLTADALDGYAPVADGTPAVGGLPPRRADAVCRCAARQGRAAGSGPARGRGAGCGPRVHGDSRLRAVVLPKCEPGAGTGGPEGRSPRVYRVSDSAFVRDRASADGIGRGGHSRFVRAYRSGNDDDLRAAAVAEAGGRDRAFAAGGPGTGAGPAGRDSAGSTGWQYMTNSSK